MQNRRAIVTDRWHQVSVTIPSTVTKRTCTRKMDLLDMREGRPREPNKVKEYFKSDAATIAKADSQSFLSPKDRNEYINKLYEEADRNQVALSKFDSLPAKEL